MIIKKIEKLTTETVNFEEVLNKSLTQGERDLFQEILADVKRDERTHLQKLIDKYNLYVYEERKLQEKLGAVLKELATLKDEDEIELLVNERIIDLNDEINYAHEKQEDVVEDIINQY